MAVNVDLRPPYPNMDPNEVHQFQERIYKAILALEAVVTPTPETADHNDILNNGGDNSHTSITLHIALKKAHGVISDIMGINDSQTVTNKEIDATNNTISNLRHGAEVDDLNVAHGTTSDIVGVSDSQTIINKVIDADDNTITNLRHGEEVDNPTEAHGSEGNLVGEDNTQTLTNKAISGLHNSFSNLRHGIEVDNGDVSVHGVLGFVVGTANAQVLIRKRVSENIYEVSADYTASEYDVVIHVTALATITLPPAGIKAGMVLKIDNQHTADITVVPHLVTETIESETSQPVPPDSCMNVQSNGLIWRIV